jgi:hypothetical protein
MQQCYETAHMSSSPASAVLAGFFAYAVYVASDCAFGAATCHCARVDVEHRSSMIRTKARALTRRGLFHVHVVYAGSDQRQCNETW